MQSLGHDLRRGLNNINPLGSNYKNINRWLGELKNIDATLATYDKELANSAKCTIAWGQNEGDDLSDVCQRMSQLLEELGLLQQAFTLRHKAYRKKIKSMKIREMALDENRKKKQDLTNQIAKLQKASKENPIKLMQLQTDLERVTAELLAQELDLMQHKRCTLKEAFEGQFDAYTEYAEKLNIIAVYGRQITHVIDTETQVADRMRLYNGAEYTAGALSQVKVALSNWQPTPVEAPQFVNLSQNDHVALSAAAAAYNSSHTSPRQDSYIQSEHEATDQQARDSWNEVKLLSIHESNLPGNLQDGYNDAGSDDNNVWNQGAGAGLPVAAAAGVGGTDADRRASYASPAMGSTTSPYLKSQSQQLSLLQEQQRQLQLEQQRIYQQNLASMSPGQSPSQQHYSHAGRGGSGSGGSGHSTPTPPRRAQTQDIYPPPSSSSSLGGNGGSGNGGYQYEPASYQTSTVSPNPSRSIRLGFVDPRERARMEQMEDSYKAEVSGPPPPRYGAME
ncbi:hypothetical protein DFQ27_008188 [Actinomortierella ambigua]|uniref:Eisosome component PIL1-domain-containing protein n=1 Tax=Actinomortierella ambigua TaxID=1343610 RepID=A0A9P6QKR6_9FUNG|nr:hypothetical protein DFQ27_008188 [Actinomortierella ambigua]